MNRGVKILILLIILGVFGLLSRWDIVWQIALVLYVLVIFAMAWTAIKLLRKPESGNKFLDKYLFDDVRMRYRQRKNM